MRTSTPTAELLEARRLFSATAVLADGVLKITGTDHADAISISLNAKDAGKLDVRLGQRSQSFDLASIASVDVTLGAGNDRFVVSQKNGPVTLPMKVDAGAGDDLVVTGAGNDVIVGMGGNDTITGGAGDDQIDGGAGNDKLSGGVDADMILGGDGTDKLLGGAGDDNLDGGAGRDAVTSGVGKDDIAVDTTGAHEIKDRPADRAGDVEYQLANLDLLPAQIQDIRSHLAQIPDAHVDRAELVGTTTNMYYHFGADPTVYKVVVDTSNGGVELVSREISPLELRAPASAAFEQAHPGTQVLSVFQLPHEVYEVHYRDADGVLQTTTTDTLVWSQDNAQDDANNDGISDGQQNGDQGGGGQNHGGQQNVVPPGGGEHS